MEKNRIASENTFVSHDGQAIFYRNWKETTPTAAKRAIVLLHRGHARIGSPYFAGY